MDCSGVIFEDGVAAVSDDDGIVLPCDHRYDTGFRAEKLLVVNRSPRRRKIGRLRGPEGESLDQVFNQACFSS